MNISVKPTDTRVDEWDLAEIRGGGYRVTPSENLK